MFFLQFWKLWHLRSFCPDIFFLCQCHAVSSAAFSFLWKFFLHFQHFCSNYGRLLEKFLKAWQNLVLQSLTCLIQFDLNKVEATMRCLTDWVQKIIAKLEKRLWRISFWSKVKIIWANTEALLRMAASEKAG